ncbi:Hypothetical predicted protein [Paramuricea clavata]|uniref:Uncharacterized protein n=1 Tax=Paramuricea clavata TaxID=317549 RepID=A0A7D9JZP1_PARCT|nr:Hypothetical predicted protein [Paramuricea clavata]
MQYNLFRSQRRVILSGVVNLRIFKNLSCRQSSPGGNSKLFENEAVKIRWYVNTSSLTIKGIDCEQLKDKLRAIARTESDEDDAISLIDKNNLDIGIHNEVERSIIIEGEDFSTRKLNSSSQVIDLSTQPNHSLICSELVEKIKDLELDVNIKISALINARSI